MNSLELIEFVKTHGGIEYTIEKMKEYQQEALKILEKYPDNEAKESLKLMVNYVIERKK
jgi:octaprenyl-diphosphate synthase